MYKIKILTIGKIKEKWLDAALTEYTKRLTPHMKLQWLLFKGEKELEAAIMLEKFFILLDEDGEQFSSVDFSKKILKFLEEQNSAATFVIGGAEGISSNIKTKCKLKISLSSLTFTHQIVRLLLLEQLYRAIEIEKGSAYHK